MGVLPLFILSGIILALCMFLPPAEGKGKLMAAAFVVLIVTGSMLTK